MREQLLRVALAALLIVQGTASAAGEEGDADAAPASTLIGARPGESDALRGELAAAKQEITRLEGQLRTAEEQRDELLRAASSWEWALRMVTVLIAGLAFVAAWLTARATRLSAEISRSSVRAVVFKDLRTSFNAFRDGLPEDLRTWDPANGKVDVVKRWLRHSFDEWFITQQLDNEVFGPLWTSYYRDAQKTVLGQGVIDVLEDLTVSSNVEADRRFRKVLKELLKENQTAKSQTVGSDLDA